MALVHRALPTRVHRSIRCSKLPTIQSHPLWKSRLPAAPLCPTTVLISFFRFIDEAEKAIRRWQVSLFDNVTTPRTLKHELTLSGRTYELIYSEVPSKGGNALYPELSRKLEASVHGRQLCALDGCS